MVRIKATETDSPHLIEVMALQRPQTYGPACSPRVHFRKEPEPDRSSSFRASQTSAWVDIPESSQLGGINATAVMAQFLGPITHDLTDDMAR